MAVPALKNFALGSLTNKNRERIAGMSGMSEPSETTKNALNSLWLHEYVVNNRGNTTTKRRRPALGNFVNINSEWTGVIVGAKKNKNGTYLILANAEYTNVNNNGQERYVTSKNYNGKLVNVNVTDSTISLNR